MKSLVVGVAGFVVGGSCLALQYPNPAGTDPHIRTVEFDGTQSVVLQVSPTVLTKVVFSKGEKVLDEGTGKEAAARRLGAWWLSIRVDKENPLGPGGNWIVTTNKRTYNLELEIVKPAQAVRELRFTYPESVEQSSRRVEQLLAERGGATYNLCYVQSPDPRIKVIHAWDDGLHTWMRFEGEPPSVSALTTDGRDEVVVDYSMESPGLARMPRVARSWILRAGDAVRRVDAYDNQGGVCVAASGPYSPRHSYTGTVSTEVNRVVREAP